MTKWEGGSVNAAVTQPKARPGFQNVWDELAALDLPEQNGSAAFVSVFRFTRHRRQSVDGGFRFKPAINQTG